LYNLKIIALDVERYKQAIRTTLGLVVARKCTVIGLVIRNKLAVINKPVAKIK